jgi:uncharacterized protein
MFGSARAVPDADAVTIEDYAADIRVWVDTIRERTDVSCVWVLGHSEGALAALVAARRPAGIRGLLLVAAAGRRLGAVLREQIGANPANAPLREEAEAIIARLEAGERVAPERVPPALQPLFRTKVQGFLISALAPDPAALLACYAGPVLILRGACDIQVGQADAERLHRARPDAELVVLPGANHVMKAVAADDRAANIAAYQDTDRPLAPGVIDALAAFVQQP